MKKYILALCFSFAAVSSVFAAEIKGTVEKIDLDNMMIKLDDGSEYKVSANIPLDLLAEGAKVILNVNDDNITTDILLTE